MIAINQSLRAQLQSIEARLSTWMVEGELIRNEIRSLLVQRHKTSTPEDQQAFKRRMVAKVKACAQKRAGGKRTR